MNKLDLLRLPKKEEFGTPQKLFSELNKEFHFVLDVAASSWNYKISRYFDKSNDGLKQDWKRNAGGGNIFMNPPYGRQLKFWIKKSFTEWNKGGITIVGLLPADISDTSYFWEYILYKAEIRYIKGRLKFEYYDKSGTWITTKPAPFSINGCNLAREMIQAGKEYKTVRGFRVRIQKKNSEYGRTEFVGIFHDGISWQQNIRDEEGKFTNKFLRWNVRY